MSNHEIDISAAVRKVAVKTVIVDGNFMRRLQKLGKRAHGLSARSVASQFHVTRPTFKAWQGGSKRITEAHAQRARILYQLWLGDIREDVTTRKVQTRDVIAVEFVNGVDARMRTLKISRKPKKCRVCKHWFEPHSGRQQRCSGCAADNRKRRKHK